MATRTITDLVGVVREVAQPLTGSRDQYDPLLDRIGDARFVLLGEASHGTHEFYRERAEITKRLIQEKGFDAVAVEADWPDAYRVNRFVRGASEDPSADAALAGFRRFPTWMWRNIDVLHFVDWLRVHNGRAVVAGAAAAKAGFYGLDLYSLQASIEEVLRYLDKVDPEAAARARYRYSCFDHANEDPQAYGYAAVFGLKPRCEDEVIRQLIELRASAADYASRDGRVAEDDFFFAEQNARLVKNAELNVGQLARERYGRDAFLVGFTTYQGTVTAASDWDRPAERKRVRPALPGSWEAAFHEAGMERFVLFPGDGGEALRRSRLERAIGVVYRPGSERVSHYFEARLSPQFDGVLHFDETRAVEPLERTSGWEAGEPPETYPSGL